MERILRWRRPRRGVASREAPPAQNPQYARWFEALASGYPGGALDWPPSDWGGGHNNRTGIVSRTSISLPPLWREGRLGLEVASLLRNPVWSGEGVRDARGQPVLLIPGFLAGDGSLGLLTNWLRRTGHHTSRAGVRLNVGCSGSLIGRIEERAEGLAERQGSRVAIVGQSRGGSLARALAVRRPDLISGVVALGSPLTEQLAVHPLIKAQVYALGALGTFGAPGLFGHSC